MHFLIVINTRRAEKPDNIYYLEEKIMSLFNKTNASAMEFATALMNASVPGRNRRSENFGQSVVNDAMEAAVPASMITLEVYRKKALNKINKRNNICGNVNPRIAELGNVNITNGVSISGNLSESNLYVYIERLCDMDIAVFKRNQMFGNRNPKIEEMLEDFPYDDPNSRRKSMYADKIIRECNLEMGKATLNNLKGKFFGA